jgi:hypothetical protein
LTRVTEISLPDTVPVFLSLPPGLLEQALVKVDLLLHETKKAIKQTIINEYFTINGIYLLQYYLPQI